MQIENFGIINDNSLIFILGVADNNLFNSYIRPGVDLAMAGKNFTALLPLYSGLQQTLCLRCYMQHNGVVPTVNFVLLLLPFCKVGIYVGLPTAKYNNYQLP